MAAYDATLRCSHLFNVLDARGAISVTERQRYILRVREMAFAVARAYLGQRRELNYPLLGEAGRARADAERAAAARARGAELLAAGRVGFVLVAGGQGSRLGFDGPKGAYEIGPVTSRSLFGWHAARIRAAAMGW